MKGWRRKIESCWKKSKSPSSTARLACVMVPLIMVFGMVILWGANSKGYNWASASNYRPWLWSWPSSTSSSMITGKTSFGGASTSLSSNVVQDPVSLSPVPKDDQGEVSVDFDHSSLPPSGLVGDAHIFNLSASPPQAIEAGETNELGIEKEEILNVTTNGTAISSSSNETHTSTLSPRIKRDFSNLERLEARLQQARLAIRGAANGDQSHDPDYLPAGPMYWNTSAFHRSYLEMEKQFKIYVYEEGEPPIFHNGPCGNIYAMEGNFIHQMEMTKFRTRDPEKAQVYFLPISVTAIVRFIFERNSRDHWKPLKKTVKDYVNLVSGRYPYWNRSLGADHLYLACHDWGPELSSSVPELYKNSIRALCNANTSEGFVPRKDVSFPEINLPGRTVKGLIGGPSPSQRPILVFFAGGLHGPIRPVLLEHWENKDEDVQVHRYLPKGVSYYGMMKKSKFCICPSGYEVASPRMVEALYTGCVPVIIKDHYVMPFGDVLNWKTFSVEIPVKDIPNLKKILTSISTRQYIRMQRRGKQVRRHFEINIPPKRYDVFHMILHSVWLRRLNIRLRGIEDF